MKATVTEDAGSTPLCSARICSTTRFGHQPNFTLCGRCHRLGCTCTTHKDILTDRSIQCLTWAEIEATRHLRLGTTGCHWCVLRAPGPEPMPAAVRRFAGLSTGISGKRMQMLLAACPLLCVYRCRNPSVCVRLLLGSMTAVPASSGNRQRPTDPSIGPPLGCCCCCCYAALGWQHTTATRICSGRPLSVRRCPRRRVLLFCGFDAAAAAAAANVTGYCQCCYCGRYEAHTIGRDRHDTLSRQFGSQFSWSQRCCVPFAAVAATASIDTAGSAKPLRQQRLSWAVYLCAWPQGALAAEQGERMIWRCLFLQAERRMIVRRLKKDRATQPASQPASMQPTTSQQAIPDWVELTGRRTTGHWSSSSLSRCRLDFDWADPDDIAFPLQSRWLTLSEKTKYSESPLRISLENNIIAQNGTS